MNGTPQASLRHVLGRLRAADATSASSTSTRRSSTSPTTSTSCSGRRSWTPSTPTCEAMADGSIDLTLFSGGIRTDRERRHGAPAAPESRPSCVAFGSCASEGCIPGPGQPELRSTELFDGCLRGPSIDNPDHLRPHRRRWATGGSELRAPRARCRSCRRSTRSSTSITASLAARPRPSASPRSWASSARRSTARRAAAARLGLGAGKSTVCDECQRDRNVKRSTRFARLQELPPLRARCVPARAGRAMQRPGDPRRLRRASARRPARRASAAMARRTA